MLFIILISGTIGWLAGIWLPWWAITSILCGFGVMACMGFFDRGLNGALAGLGTTVMCSIMIVVGFVSGGTTLGQVGGFIKLLFTGS